MIGIIGAMKVELEALKARLQDVTVTRISGVDFYSGKLHGTDVVATVSGVGKVFAAVDSADEWDSPGAAGRIP